MAIFSSFPSSLKPNLKSKSYLTPSDIFRYVQRLFLTCHEFDRCMIFFIRKLTANFLLNEEIRKKEINGLPIEVATIVDADTYEDYISDVVMQFGRDAQGLLLLVVPVIMKMSIHIVNIDTSAEAKTFKDMAKFSVVEGPARHQDLMHLIQGDSALNLHDQTLYALRKDGHYDALFSTGAAQDCASPDAARRVNASFIQPRMTLSDFDQDFADVLDPKVESLSSDANSGSYNTNQNPRA